MVAKILLFSFLRLFSSASAIPTSTCQPIQSTSICQSLLPYNLASIPDETCQSGYERIVNQSLTTILGVVNPTCQLSLSQYLCSIAYPSCPNGNNETILPCASFCQTFWDNSSSCASDLSVVLQLTNDSSIFASAFNCTDFVGGATPCYTPDPSLAVTPLTLPSCGPYQGTVCQGFVDYPIYVAPITAGLSTVEELETLLQPLSAAKTIVSGDCYLALMKYACGQAFLKCDNQTLSMALNRSLPFEPSFASLPCQSICQGYSVSCSDQISYLASLNPSLFSNCNSFGRLLGNASSCTSVPVGVDDFPMNETLYFNGSDLRLAVQCNTLGTTAPVDTSCIYPLVDASYTTFKGVIRREYPTSNCELPVSPSYFITERRFKQTQAGMWTNIPSVFGLVFVTLTWLIFPRKKNQRYVLWINLCVTVWTTINAFAFAAGHGNLENFMRQNPVEPYTKFIPANFCVLQGFATFVCGLCSCCWWFVLAIDLYLKSVLELRLTREQERKKNYLYHAFGWGFPHLMLMIFLSAGGYFGSAQIQVTAFCFIYPEVSDALQFSLFFGPIGTIATVGAGLMIPVLWKIYTTTTAVTKSGSQERARQKLRKFLLRPTMFLLLMLQLFIWIFYFRVNLAVFKTRIVSVMSEWVSCLQNSNGNTQLCGLEPRIGFPFVAYWGLHFCLSIQGIVIFLLWGTMEENFYLWYGFLTRKGLNYRKGDRANSSNLAESGRMKSSPKKPGDSLHSPLSISRQITADDTPLPAESPTSANHFLPMSTTEMTPIHQFSYPRNSNDTSPGSPSETTTLDNLILDPQYSPKGGIRGIDPPTPLERGLTGELSAETSKNSPPLFSLPVTTSGDGASNNNIGVEMTMIDDLSSSSFGPLVSLFNNKMLQRGGLEVDESGTTRTPRSSGGGEGGEGGREEEEKEKVELIKEPSLWTANPLQGHISDVEADGA